VALMSGSIGETPLLCSHLKPTMTKEKPRKLYQICPQDVKFMEVADNSMQENMLSSLGVASGRICALPERNF
jgi:hypothetical protein